MFKAPSASVKSNIGNPYNVRGVKTGLDIFRVVVRILTPWLWAICIGVGREIKKRNMKGIKERTMYDEMQDVDSIAGFASVSYGSVN